MNPHFSSIKTIVKNHAIPLTKSKQDGSPVTELDLALSSYIEELFQRDHPEYCFYSEENFKEWRFPLLALDPLDGTREYVDGRPEWALSLGLFADDDFDGEGWVYNPVTDERFTMETVALSQSGPKLLGEASRTEFAKGLYRSLNDPRIDLRPRGSIAYKLGKLSSGKLDFVVSLRPKNIWDVAGGSLLCKKAGLAFYSQGQLVTKVKPSYEPPLLWCRPSEFSYLSRALSS